MSQGKARTHQPPMLSTGIRDLTDGASEFDLHVDDPGENPGSPPPLRGFRGRWLSRDRNALEEASGAGAIVVPQILTGRWTAYVPANPESPPGVVVAERDAKDLANHTFLSNVSGGAFPCLGKLTGVMKNIFGDDVIGLTSDLRQDVSWLEAVTHVPVSTIAADSAHPSSSGPELQPAFVKCVKAIREESLQEMREAEMKAAVTKWSLFLRSSLDHSIVGRQINASPGEMLDIVRAAMGVKSPSTVLSRANSMLAFRSGLAVRVFSEIVRSLSIESHQFRASMWFLSLCFRSGRIVAGGVKQTSVCVGRHPAVRQERG